MSGAQVTCKQKVEKDNKTLASEKFLELKWHQSSLRKKKERTVSMKKNRPATI